MRVAWMDNLNRTGTVVIKFGKLRKVVWDVGGTDLVLEIDLLELDK